MFELPTEIVRCDATTVSGYHTVVEDGIFQFGHSKDNPDLPQVKLMTGALDPLGMPLATDIVSGEQADDGLYIPVIDRINEYLHKKDVLYVGDSKMSAFHIRLHLKGIKKHYLCPLPMTGKTPKNMEIWVNEGVSRDKKGELIDVYGTNNKGEKILKAKGYELERLQAGIVKDKTTEWTERVLVVYSPDYAKAQAASLEKRLKKAEEKIYALTPQRGPGKRQITDENVMIDSIDKILKQYKVKGLLACKYRKEVESKEKYIGRGRGSENRPKRIVEKIRYQLLNITRNNEEIKAEKEKLGWKAYVTDVSSKRFSFTDTILCYRNEYRVERIFNRLKSHLNISPQYVQREDQIVGMNRLLTLAVRVLVVIEFIVRRSLQNDSEKLDGLHPENSKKMTNIPTGERLLKAFAGLTLTIIEVGGVIIRHITPLSPVQIKILEKLGMSPSIYEDFEINRIQEKLNE